MGGPHSAWMMQKIPINYSVRLGTSLWLTCAKKSKLETFRERYKIPNTIEMFVPTPDE